MQVKSHCLCEIPVSSGEETEAMNHKQEISKTNIKVSL